jgi:sulfate permease, SulP family
MSSIAVRPTFAELFTPKLITVLRGGYGWKDIQADIFAGLTVAIGALPLSMAIAIACGVTPERGLYTSITSGFIVSVLGGSRFQIGAPAGAFIVLIYDIVAAKAPARRALLLTGMRWPELVDVRTLDAQVALGPSADAG